MPNIGFITPIDPTIKISDLKDFEQQDTAVIHKVVNAALKTLQVSLFNDKQVKFKALQSYLSEYDIVDELRAKLIAPSNIVDIIKLYERKPIVEVFMNHNEDYSKIKTGIYAAAKNEFSPPIPEAYNSIGGISNLYLTPYNSDQDPRRTARIIKLDPPETIKTNIDWFVNNSLLYGFLLYGDINEVADLIYVGDKAIKTYATNNATVEKTIKYYIKEPDANFFGSTPELPLNITITFEKIKAFAPPAAGNGEPITTHTATLNDNKTRPNLIVVDGKAIMTNNGVADAFLKMQKAANENGIPLRLMSGFRPSLGTANYGYTQSGKKIDLTTQETLRRDKSRWITSERAKFTNDEDFIMKATSSAYDPATAPPGRSQHGNGIAVDVNTGGRNNFKSLNEGIYKWMIQNSWKYGFVRTVSSEEWHYEYHPQAATKGPYAKLTGNNNNNKFYANLGLDNISTQTA